MIKKRKQYHGCMTLDRLLKLTLEGENVLNISEAEVYPMVRGLKAKGYSYFSPCTNVDKEGRCKGHGKLI